MRYLDPKADLTFKKIFGERKNLVISFLNSMLPLSDEIVDIEYLSPELVPDNPLRKNSIVDVRCRDTADRIFIVEMQMNWSAEFKQRVLYNATKAYARQIGSGEDYSLLKPVYCLALVNDVFEKDLEGYYHHYRLVHEEHTDKVIEGLQLLLIELPKYNPETFCEKRMRSLWLRFLTEIKTGTKEIDSALMSEPVLKEAVTILTESSFTNAELAAYERFWDIISTEKTLATGKFREGREVGRKEGREEGKSARNKELVLALTQKGKSVAYISDLLDISSEEVESLLD